MPAIPDSDSERSPWSVEALFRLASKRWSLLHIVEQRHESEVHMQLLVAMEDLAVTLGVVPVVQVLTKT